MSFSHKLLWEKRKKIGLFKVQPMAIETKEKIRVALKKHWENKKLSTNEKD
jgi:hypothetical protein